MDDKIKRINELYAKSKAEGLTPQELEEQTTLRQEYAKGFRQNLKNQIDNIDVKYEDGKTVPLSSFKKPSSKILK